MDNATLLCICIHFYQHNWLIYGSFELETWLCGSRAIIRELFCGQGDNMIM